MQRKQNTTGLIWFRNDLRVQDNNTLKVAIENNLHVLALYCFDPRHFTENNFGFKKTQRFRAKFLLETVTNLKDNLQKLGITLLTYHDKPEDIIENLVKTYSITTIYYQNEFTCEELAVESQVKNKLPKNVICHSEYNQFLYHPDTVFNQINNIPNVFTNFRKQIEKSCSVRPAITIPKFKNSNTNPFKIQTNLPALNDLGFNDFEICTHSAFPFKGGECEALQRLQYYLFESKKITDYKNTRNQLLGIEYSSKLSAWLANGSISARTIYWEIKKFEKEHTKNDSTYWLIFELIWRDFFKYIALEHGNSIFKIDGINANKYRWNVNKNNIKQWISGTTPEPFVNANIIELNKTGWMSNRGRQIVASYFTKQLKIDWRIGASYFESMLIDFDVHSNYGNWMYVSGVGNDPRNRSFNVRLQAERYDSNGKYQHIWLQK